MVGLIAGGTVVGDFVGVAIGEVGGAVGGFVGDGIITVGENVGATVVRGSQTSRKAFFSAVTICKEIAVIEVSKPVSASLRLVSSSSCSCASISKRCCFDDVCHCS